MDEVDIKNWLNAVVWGAPRRLMHKLGVPDAQFPKRFEVIYALARALRYNPDDLRHPTLVFLDALVQPLGDAMTAHPDDWVNLVGEGDHERAVGAAVAGIPLGELYKVVVDLGCRRERVNCYASEVPDVLRDILRTEVSRRLLMMFTNRKERAAAMERLSS